MPTAPSGPSPLLALLREEIRQRGRMTFARFMELCLYHPQHGYYNTEPNKLGASGDFYTSAHAGPVFARLLARHLERLWRELGKPARFDLVELGPGEGRLPQELLPWAARRLPEFSSHLHYTAVEQSSAMSYRLLRSLRSFGGRVRVVSTLPPKPAGESVACIFANEFFDALPFHILRWRAGRWHESYVCRNDDDLLMWCLEVPSSVSLVIEAESRWPPEQPRPDPQEESLVAEISPLAADWMHRLCAWLDRGEVLIVDYGYTNREWQAGRFRRGSALAYKAHRVVEDLLASPGAQDLTAHVNFSQLTEAGEQSGLRMAAFVSQAKFLLNLGEQDEFADLFSDCATEEQHRQRSLQLKTLIVPEGMGETFQVLQMRKSV